jgi:putative ABC transport system substrate-binding protein
MEFRISDFGFNKRPSIRWGISSYLLISIVLITELARAGEPPTKVHRVGVLALVRADRPQLKGLRDGLRRAGYIENEDILLEMPAAKDLDELRVIAKNFCDAKKTVIVTTGTVETRIAQEAKVEVPVIFMPASDPIRAGFVESLAQPGGNITGISWDRGVEIYGKELEIFKQVVPAMERLALLYDGRSKQQLFPKGLTFIRKVAAHLRITLMEKPVKSLGEAERFIASLSRKEADAVFFVSSSLFNDFSKITPLAREKKLPVYSAGNADDGALVSYAPDLYQLGQRAASYVDRIIKGTKPQQLPVEASAKFELVINMLTAREIGLTVAPEVLLRADRLIR